jgi:hypothetical protein
VVADLLRSHLALQPGAAARHHAVREYNEAGLEALTVVMRKERTPVGQAGGLGVAYGLSRVVGHELQLGCHVWVWVV